MKKLIIILVVALSYSLTFAEDYNPDEQGKNWDKATVRLTTKCIAPIEGEWSSANAINDVIDGTIRNYADNEGNQGELIITGEAGYSYTLTFGTEFTHPDVPLVIKGKWWVGTTAVTSPYLGSGETKMAFRITQVDATSTDDLLVPASYAFTIPVTVVYNSI